MSSERSAAAMRILAIVVRCKWRTKCAARVRSFCQDFGSHSRFGKMIRAFRWKVVRNQRHIRSFLVCKRARVAALIRLWDHEICDHSWLLETAAKRLYAYCQKLVAFEHAHKRRKWEEEERRRKMERESMRPHLRINLFPKPAQPREAAFLLRHRRDRLSEKRRRRLEAKVGSWKSGVELHMTAQRFNASLERINIVSEILDEAANPTNRREAIANIIKEANVWSRPKVRSTRSQDLAQAAVLASHSSKPENQAPKGIEPHRISRRVKRICIKWLLERFRAHHFVTRCAVFQERRSGNVRAKAFSAEDLKKVLQSNDDGGSRDSELTKARIEAALRKETSWPVFTFYKYASVDRVRALIVLAAAVNAMFYSESGSQVAAGAVLKGLNDTMRAKAESASLPADASFLQRLDLSIPL